MNHKTPVIPLEETEFNQDHFDEEIKILKIKGRYRSLRMLSSISGPEIIIDGKKLINFASNNYLGLSQSLSVKREAAKALWRFGAGAGASRLVSGTTVFHERLENAIAEFKGTEAALVYSTGYMANLGAISTLIGEEDLIILDHFNHASIVEAARLSKAKIWVYPHADVQRLNEILKNASERSFRRKWVITETLFSMDGDIAPLPEISEICRKYKAFLMIDEAHATGVLGDRGRGAMEYFSMTADCVDIMIGTLSKALGSLGGFVAAKRNWIEYLCNESKSFIYTTALSAGCCAAALKAIEILQKKNTLIRKLQENISYFLNGLKTLNFELPKNPTSIIPIIIGDDFKVVKAAEVLEEFGIFAPAIRPPTVPEGQGRIRFSLMSNHKMKHLDKALEALNKLKQLSI
jgi:8-amino-7-oxononanoate synthase